MARDASRLVGRFDGAEIVEGDAGDAQSIQAACAGVEVAYYLIHAMSDTMDFGDADHKEMMLSYARLRNLKRTLLIVPFFTPRLSLYWVTW